MVTSNVKVPVTVTCQLKKFLLHCLEFQSYQWAGAKPCD